MKMLNPFTLSLIKYKLDVYVIGITGGNKIKLNNAINITVDDAKKSWENGLRDKL